MIFSWYHFSTINTKQRRTLDQMFIRPTPSGLRWADISSLLGAVGVKVSERSGSRVLLTKGADRMVVHRPHPNPETGKATVRDITAFLYAIGVRPK
jgi:hypothetical protein